VSSYGGTSVTTVNKQTSATYVLFRIFIQLYFYYSINPTYIVYMNKVTRDKVPLAEHEVKVITCDVTDGTGSAR